MQNWVRMVRPKKLRRLCLHHQLQHYHQMQQVHQQLLALLLWKVHLLQHNLLNSLLRRSLRQKSQNPPKFKMFHNHKQPLKHHHQLLVNKTMLQANSSCLTRYTFSYQLATSLNALSSYRITMLTQISTDLGLNTSTLHSVNSSPK